MTLLIVLLLVGAIILIVGRPLARKVDDYCQTADREREAREVHERLEKEEEARYRAQAVSEVDEQFPNMKEGSN